MSGPVIEGARPAPAAARPDLIEAVWYTDPLCSWSRAFEPHWRRLRAEFDDRLVWRIRMSGMIPDWTRYGDPIHAVDRPARMAPLWFQAAQVSGLPFDDRILYDDPPDSSFPACLAVKAAERQSPEAGERMLCRLREALMVRGRNIARREAILDVAAEVARDAPARFDAERFAQDLDDDATRQAFEDDLKEVGRMGIGRFPTLTLRRPGGPGVIVVGYRPYDVLLAAVARVAPDMEVGR